MVIDSHKSYKTFANKNKIRLRQIPPDKHTSGPYNLAKLNSCHGRLAGFMAKYKEVSSKYIDHYVALFRWQKNTIRIFKPQPPIVNIMMHNPKYGKYVIAFLRENRFKIDLTSLSATETRNLCRPLNMSCNKNR